MSKHLRQRPGRWHKQTATAQPRTVGALTAERCTALAAELAVMRDATARAADALAALAEAGGEASAPLGIRAEAAAATLDWGHVLKASAHLIRGTLGA